MENLKEKIVNQAIEMFLQYGIRSVSIDDICRQMGISKKTFYVYFDQKSDLVDAILSQITLQLSERLKKQMTEKPMVEVLLDFAAKERNLQEMHRPPQVVFDLEKYYPQLMAKHKKLIGNAVKQIVAQSLQRGIEEGVFWNSILEVLQERAKSGVDVRIIYDDVEMCAEIFAKLHQYLMETVNLPNFKLKEHKRAIDCAVTLLIRGIVSEQGTQQVKEIMERKNYHKTK